MPIRPANHSDIPALIHLLNQILNVHHDIRPDIFRQEGSKFSPEELEALLKDSQKPVFVYVDDHHQVLGHLFLEIKQAEHPVKHPLTSLHIEDLCVAQSNRGLGIGRQLYEFAKTYAKEQNCYNIILNVWNDNTQAKEFYLNLGLKPQQIQLEERL